MRWGRGGRVVTIGQHEGGEVVNREENSVSFRPFGFRMCRTVVLFDRETFGCRNAKLVGKLSMGVGEKKRGRGFRKTSVMPQTMPRFMCPPGSLRHTQSKFVT